MRVLDDWLLTPWRAALHLHTGTAVVADLHLGYGSARRRAGEAVPVRDISATLAPLGTALARHNIGRLVVAGDLLEEGRGPVAQEVIEGFLAWVGETRLELVGVVPGNHDRGLEAVAGLPLFPQGVMLGGWRVVHGDGAQPEGACVQGHEHPCLNLPGGLRAPCFLFRRGRLVLPAWSADAAGVNVLSDPRWADYRCGVIAGDEVLDFGEAGTLRRRLREAQ